MAYKTKSREKLLEYFETVDDKPFSVADIQEYLKKQNVDINVVTIYRNLDRMVQDGQLMQHKSSDSKAVMYSLTKEHDCHNHLHLKCKICGRMIHLECDLMDTIREHLMEEHGFSLECEGSIIMGLCADCRTKLIPV